MDALAPLNGQPILRYGSRKSEGGLRLSMDGSENTDKWQQIERWKTQLYQIGNSGEDDAVGANLLDVWCAHLHRAAAQLSPYVHSFYVCLFVSEDVEKGTPLHFVYASDEGYRAELTRRPMGSGPTSLVMRTGQPYVLTPQTRLFQAGGNRFGDMGRASLSAVHLPLRHWRTDGAQVRGVISAQSYRTGLWTRRDTQFVLDLQSRADEAAQHWFNTLQKSPAA